MVISYIACTMLQYEGRITQLFYESLCQRLAWICNSWYTLTCRILNAPALPDRRRDSFAREQPHAPPSTSPVGTRWWIRHWLLPGRAHLAQGMRVLNMLCVVPRIEQSNECCFVLSLVAGLLEQWSDDFEGAGTNIKTEERSTLNAGLSLALQTGRLVMWVLLRQDGPTSANINYKNI